MIPWFGYNLSIRNYMCFWYPTQECLCSHWKQNFCAISKAVDVLIPIIAFFIKLASTEVLFVQQDATCLPTRSSFPFKDIVKNIMPNVYHWGGRASLAFTFEMLENCKSKWIRSFLYSLFRGFGSFKCPEKKNVTLIVIQHKMQCKVYHILINIVGKLSKS